MGTRSVGPKRASTSSIVDPNRAVVEVVTDVAVLQRACGAVVVVQVDADKGCIVRVEITGDVQGLVGRTQRRAVAYRQCYAGRHGDRAAYRHQGYLGLQ